MSQRSAPDLQSDPKKFQGSPRCTSGLEWITREPKMGQMQVHDMLRHDMLTWHVMTCHHMAVMKWHVMT